MIGRLNEPIENEKKVGINGLRTFFGSSGFGWIFERKMRIFSWWKFHTNVISFHSGQCVNSGAFAIESGNGDDRNSLQSSGMECCERRKSQLGIITSHCLKRKIMFHCSYIHFLLNYHKGFLRIPTTSFGITGRPEVIGPVLQHYYQCVQGKGWKMVLETNHQKQNNKLYISVINNWEVGIKETVFIKPKLAKIDHLYLRGDFAPKLDADLLDYLPNRRQCFGVSNHTTSSLQDLLQRDHSVYIKELDPEIILDKISVTTGVGNKFGICMKRLWTSVIIGNYDINYMKLSGLR
ncbi:hypothetical protein RND71_005236 [Anisodus tanguticus]|uniref:Uncharacterized protein n=1 Tax=Anisodus tanguticus TaxID=243964 RepID=A0AAE1VUV0_9SOLA|nr:hypothetical protein RND71_005236 [Anisodus tanguticus]